MKMRIIVPGLIVVTMLAGCSTFQPRRSAGDSDQIAVLQAQIARLEADKEREIQRALNDQQRKLSDLERAKLDLEYQLKKEIGDYQARLEMTERGLIITFLAEIFFDSGKDMVKTDGKTTLQKVASVLNDRVLKSTVAVEGHTDNEPIKFSDWKSNWELSTARALSVVHFFIDTCDVDPERLSAVGYGEYRPIASNETPAGRQKNRRVEIVILPVLTGKVKAEL